MSSRAPCGGAPAISGAPAAERSGREGPSPLPVLGRQERPGPVAVLGCVYGNVPAFRACLDDAAGQGATLRVFLGDLTGTCGHSDEIVDLVRSSCEVIIAGNHEQQAAIGSATCGCGHRDAEDERRACLAHAFAMTSLSDDRRAWMGALPAAGVVDLAHGRLRCCHGSPERINEFLYASTLDDVRLAGWLDATGAAVLACTHTGLPWVRHLPGGRLAVNCGAAGAPDDDGDPAVHYALLRGGGTGWSAEIRRVAYDHIAWTDRILAEGAEPAMVACLRSGWKACGLGNLPADERAQAEGRRRAGGGRLPLGDHPQDRAGR